jgi:hypothetical protein
MPDLDHDPGKDALRQQIQAALRAWDLHRARRLADSGLRRFDDPGIARLALTCRLRQADRPGTLHLFAALPQHDWAEAFAGLERPETSLLWQIARDLILHHAGEALLRPRWRQEELASLLKLFAQLEEDALAQVLDGLLALARQGVPGAALLAFAVASPRKQDQLRPAQWDDIAAALAAAWPSLLAGPPVPDSMLEQPAAPLPPAAAGRLAPLLAEALIALHSPTTTLALLAPLAEAAAALAGPEAVARYLRHHDTSSSEAATRLLVALRHTQTTHAPAIGPTPAQSSPASLDRLRDLAGEGVWLPLLLRLQQTPDAVREEDARYQLRFNPALLRLRSLLRQSLEQLPDGRPALQALQTLLEEGDRETVLVTLASRPALQATEAGSLLALRAAATSAEWHNALPSLPPGALTSPNAVRTALRLLLAELDQDAAQALLDSMPAGYEQQRQALQLEFLRTTGQLAAWNALAQASGPLEGAPPDLWRELRLWQDEQAGATPAPAAPSLARTADDLRADIRNRMFQRRFDEAADLSARLTTSGENAADWYTHVLALCQAERFPAALQVAMQARTHFPADPRFAGKLAQIAEAMEDFELALHSWQVLGARDPASPQAQAGTARALLALRRPDALHTLLDSLEADSPDRLWVHNLRALWQVRDGQLQAAQAAYSAGEHLACRFLQSVQHRASANPRQAYVYGRWLQHPQAEHARSLSLFQHRFAARLADAQRPVVIVGNSPQLLGGQLGARIDSFGTVVRLNDFTIDGFEDHVGRRTDLWYSSGNRHARKHDMRDFDLAVIGTSPAQQMPDMEEFGRLRLGLQLDPARCCLLPPAYAALSAGAAYPKPTSGLRMILLANYLSPAEVHIAGFDFFTRHKEHYFDVETGAHRPGETHVNWYERDLVEQVLQRFGRIRALG